MDLLLLLFQIGCVVCAVVQHTKTKVINMFLNMEIIGKISANCYSNVTTFPLLGFGGEYEFK
jgi:hypothetical protein